MSPVPRQGILLVNIGSPEAPTSAAVRSYLREFLSDRRVVDTSRVIWWPLLNLVILPLRSPRSARLYRRIWTDRGSPLLVTSQSQAEALAEALERRTGTQIPVATGMRYGRPSIADGLIDLAAAGCDRVVVLPLYPQYSRTTTESARDALAAAQGGLEIEIVNDYHEHPAYIRALAATVRQRWAADGEPRHLVISFHGLPRRYADAGDPYPRQCETTARALAKALLLDEDEWSLAYQSRFSREEWLRPYTDEVLLELADRGLGTVDIICPGFAADCLETLEEVAIGLREVFAKASGGGELRYIPALNERKEHIRAMAEIVTPYLPPA